MIINNEEVWVYYWDLADIYLPENLVLLLDEAEREVYYRYRVEPKRQEFLAGRILAKQLLAKWLGVKVGRIYFEKNAYGKLYLGMDLKAPTGETIQFNLSHAENLVVLAVGLKNEVGVDVIKVNKPIIEIVERYFAAAEKSYILSLPGHLQHEAAYKLWTMKEAYLKAKGAGLAIPLESFNVLSNNELFFHSLEPKPGYQLTVAVEKKNDLNLKINAVEVAILGDSNREEGLSFDLKTPLF